MFAKAGRDGAGRKERNKKAKKTEEIGNSLDATCWQKREKKGKEIWEHHFLTSVSEINVNLVFHWSSWHKKFYCENMWNYFFSFINFMSWKIVITKSNHKDHHSSTADSINCIQNYFRHHRSITVNELETSQWYSPAFPGSQLRDDFFG